MPSPFPGMDPYLEDRHLWAGFHNSLADEISKALNRDLPPPYWSQIEMRTEVGIADESRPREAVSDVSVHAAANGGGRSGSLAAEQLAVLDGPRTEISASRRVRYSVEPYRLASIEVRDPRKGRELVTMIEILSPSNKRGGADRRGYLRKRRSLLAGHVSLIELDLLRNGRRSWSEPPGLVDLAALPRPLHYLIAVNRAWHRGTEFQFDLFSLSVADTLPVIPVPLREGEKETPLDVQYCFQLAYDGGPYRRGAVDYDQPPPAALPPEMEDWRASCIRSWRGEPNESGASEAGSARSGA